MIQTTWSAQTAEQPDAIPFPRVVAVQVCAYVVLVAVSACSPLRDLQGAVHVAYTTVPVVAAMALFTWCSSLRDGLAGRVIAAVAGADDVADDGEVFTVITEPGDLVTVRKALQDAGIDYDSADLVQSPKNEVELSLEDARKVSKLIDNLDDLDDVQNIYSNWTASDEVMAQLDEE